MQNRIISTRPIASMRLPIYQSRSRFLYQAPRTWIQRPGITLQNRHTRARVPTRIIPTIYQLSYSTMAGRSSGLPPLSDHEFKLYNRMADKMQGLVGTLFAAVTL